MSKNYIVLECKGKQFIVREGDIISVDSIEGNPADIVTFDKVLMHSDNGKVEIGAPYLDMAAESEIVAHEKDDKVVVFKFKKKTGYKKKQGHRQKYTTIKILNFKKKTK